MDVPASAIRRYARQAKRGTKPPDTVMNATDRSGFRIADEWDYIADMQDCIRAMGNTPSVMRTANAALPAMVKRERTPAQKASDERLGAFRKGSTRRDGARNGA